MIKSNIAGGPSPDKNVNLIAPAGGGSGLVSLSNSTLWPANLFNNTITDVTFANVGAKRSRTKAGFTVTNWGSAAAGDAPALTNITANSSGATLTVANARPFYDGWNIRGEVGDYIYIGTTAAAAESAGPVQILSIDYPNGLITLTATRSVTSGEGVWFGGNPVNGGPTIRKNRGASAAVADVGPAAPTALMATAVSSSQIDLAWTDSSADETAFRIRRKEGPGGAYADTTPATVAANTTTFSDTAGVAGGTTYYYQVRAENASGNSVWSNEAGATTPVPDTTAPEITLLTATPDHLWPANHKLVAVTLAVTATDDRDPAPVTKILSVSSSEAANGSGDGNTAVDWEITGDLTLNLRAERSGNGPGRLYTVTVQSTDASGNSSTASVLIPVGHNNDTQAPSVALTAPSGGALVGGTVALAATASDNDSVVGVQFKLDGASLGVEDASSPYGLAWNTTTATNGNHTLTAVARDENGNLATAAPVVVFVDNAPPSVVLTAPVEDSLLTGAGIPVAAAAADNVAVAGVQFRLDGAGLGAEDTAAPYATSLDTTGLTDGSHSLTAVARDTLGHTATSATVTVTTDNQPPTVALTAPADGTVIGGPAVALTATATDLVGVAAVQFQVDGVNLGAEDTAAPYNVVWDTTLAADGVHTLTAVARDLVGHTAASAPVAATVDNTAPVVVLTAPADGATVSGNVAVAASATDANALAGVQFKLDGVNLGAEDTTAPYGLAWNTTTVANGSHTLTAVARDAIGNASTSAPISVLVDNVAPDIAFRGASSVTTGSGGGNSLTVPKPAGVQEGDFMLAALTVGLGSPPVTPPAGWALVRSVTDGCTLSVYAKQAGASEPANYTWTIGASRKLTGGIVAFSGVQSATPIQSESGAGEAASGTTHTTPGITSSGSSTWLVSFFSDRTGVGSTWTASGADERVDTRNTGSNSGSLAIYTSGPVSPGGHTQAATASASSADATMEIIALQP